ncbi:MAG: DUF4347 domain-containing protein [Methylococcales bacterium]
MRKDRRFNSKPVLEELEARQLFSAGIEGLLLDHKEPEFAVYQDIGANDTFAVSPKENQPGFAVLEPFDQSFQQKTTGQQNQVTDVEKLNTDKATPVNAEAPNFSALANSNLATSKEIIFVDTNVKDYQQLLGGINSDAQVILLDSNKDGVAQIDQVLANQQNLKTIHILSHGSEGAIEIGNTQLNLTTLSSHLKQVSAWGNALSADGDILLYGCNVAEGEAGKLFVRTLGQLTAADIAASDNLTGNAAEGGDWRLEFSTGNIDATIAPNLVAQATWQEVLTTTNLAPTANSDSVSGGEDTVITGSVLTNDTDANGNALTATLVSGPSHAASFTLNTDGSFSYTPSLDWSGNDSFQYLVNDGVIGITHYWGLEGNAIDSVGSSNGSIVNGSATVTGLYGNALQFDGVDDHVVLPDVSYTGNFSLALYFKVDDNSGTGLQYLYSHGAIPNSPNTIQVALTESSYIGSTPVNNLVTTVWDSNDTSGQIYTDVSTLIGDGQWHLYTMTVTAGIGTQVYVDGGLLGSLATGSDSIDPVGNVYLGARSDLDPTRFLNANGEIDGVVLYNRALDVSEVASLASNSPQAPVNITITAVNDTPIVSTTGSAMGYTHNDPATAVDNALTLSDVDSTHMASATVSISSGYVNGQDTLAFTNQNGITGSWNASTGVLTLSGSATVANYQSALRSIAYFNSSSNPSLATRTLSFFVNDGLANSSIATRNISLSAMASNSTPSNTTPGAQTTSYNSSLIFSSANGNQLSVNDANAGSSPLEVTLSVSNGTLALASVSGLSFTSGSGAADSTMTFSGTVSDLNNALNGLDFTPTNNFNGIATLTLSTLDSTLYSLNIDTSLKGRYAFENTSALGTDSSPAAAYPGTVDGATALNDATRGNVLSLGGNAYIQTPGFFGSPTNVTLSAWVNLNTASAGGADVISLGDNVLIRLDGSGGLIGGFYNGSTWIGTTYNTLLAGTGWHHVAFSFDDTGDKTALYLDGTLVGSITTTDSIHYTLGIDSFIGRHGNGGTTFDFNGKIDDARIYNRVLSAGEVAALANDSSLTPTNTTPITVLAVNILPVNTVPATLTFNEDSTTAIAGLSITDPDAGSSTLRTELTVSSGTLSASSGGAVNVTGSGTSTLILTGTLTDLNAYLASAAKPTYTGATNSNGAVTLTMVTSDGLNTGIGGSLAAGTFDYRFQDGAPTGSNPNLISVTGGMTGVATNLSAPSLANTLTGSTTTFGVIYSGILNVTTAGTYTFTVAADDAATLFVDGTQVLLAWFGSSSNTATLTAGQHSIELHYAQDTGGAGLNASYSGPDTFSTTTPLLSAPNVGRLVSQTASTAITVTAVNDAPMLTDGGSAFATVSNWANPFTGVVTLTDPDSPDFNGGSLTATISSGENTDFLLLLGIGGVSLSGSNVLVDGVTVGTWSGGSNGTLLSVNFNANAQVAKVQAVYQSITFGTTSVTPTLGIRTISVVVTDGDGGISNTATGEVDLTGTGVANNAPIFSNLDGTPTYTQGGAAVLLDSDVTITDPELTAADNFNGATLTLARSNGVNAQDVFNASGSLGTLTQGNALVVGASTIGAVTTNSGGTLTFTFNASATNILVNQAMQQIAYSNNSSTPPASVQINWIINDNNSGAQGTGGPASSNGSSIVNITSVNDAPVLSPIAPTLTTITEDNIANPGQTVASFLGNSISDVDSGALQGIAITDVSTGTVGYWEYSIDGGSNWAWIGAVSESSARLLGATDLIRYHPDQAQGETVSFTYHAWDLSVGISGNLGNASANGGTSAFSMATDTASITVTNINDAPLAAPQGYSLTAITEDQTSNAGETVKSFISHGSFISINAYQDLDPADQIGIALISTNDGNGYWEYSLDNGAQWYAVGSVSSNSALLLKETDRVRFVPDSLTATSASLSYRFWDQTAGTEGTKVDTSSNGGTTAFSTGTDNSAISVTTVNDAPVLDMSKSPALNSIAEDNASPSGAAGTLVSTLVDFATPGGQLDNVTDADALSGLGIALTGANNSNGIWFYSTDNGSSWNTVGSVSDTSALLLNADSVTRLYFQANANYSGSISDAITFRAWDQGFGSNGTLADASINGGSTAYSATSDSAPIIISAMNDAPVATADSYTVAEDGTLTIAAPGVLANDMDIEGTALTAALVNFPSHYSVFNFTTGGNIVYTPTANFNGTDTFSYIAGDGLLWSQVVTVTITVTPQNDAPSITFVSGNPTVPENDGPFLLASGALITDIDSADFDTGQLVITISANGLPEDRLTVRNEGHHTNQVDVSGSDILYNGIVVASFNGPVTGYTPLVVTFNSNASLAIVQDIARNVTYENTSNAPSSTARVLEGYLTDGDGGISATLSGSISITAVNDAPILNTSADPVLTAMNEGSGIPVGTVGTRVEDLVDFTLPAGQLDNVVDPDTGAQLGIAIRSVDTSHGSWWYSIDNGSNWNPTGILSSSNALLLAADNNTRIYFQPDANWNGTLANALDFRAWDLSTGSNGSFASTSSNGGSTAFSHHTDSAGLTVIASNDAPLIISNGGGSTASISLAENIGIVTTVTATDIDLPAQKLVYSLYGGDDQGLFSIDPNSGVLSFTSPPDYETPGDFNHDNIYDVTIQVNDGNGGVATQTLAIQINNTAESAALSLSGLSNVSINENTAFTSPTPSLTGSPVGTVVYTLSGADAGLFSVSPATGVVSMAARDFENPEDSDNNNSYQVTLTVTDSDNNSTSLSFSVQVLNIAESATLNLSGLSNVSINENTAFTSPTPSLTGSPVGTVVYTLSGADAGLFSVSPATGVVSMAARDFENPQDANTDNVYQVTLTATDSKNNSASLNFTVKVENLLETPSNHTSLGLPVIMGIVTEDGTLTVDTSDISDDNGLGEFSYQWFRNNAIINGANGKTYTLGDADVGQQISVKASYIDGSGNPESVNSTLTAPVSNINDAPFGTVTITGTASQGQTLIAGNSLTDADGLGAIHYQWQRNGVDIPGANGNSYVLGLSDVNNVIRVVASYTDAHGTPESKSSEDTAIIIGTPTIPVSAPVIIGSMQVNQILNIDTLGITNIENIHVSGYQWFRNGVAVIDATNSSYVLSDQDIGSKISVQIFYTDKAGLTKSVMSSSRLFEVSDTPINTPIKETTTPNSLPVVNTTQPTAIVQATLIQPAVVENNLNNPLLILTQLPQNPAYSEPNQAFTNIKLNGHSEPDGSSSALAFNNSLDKFIANLINTNIVVENTPVFDDQAATTRHSLKDILEDDALALKKPQIISFKETLQNITLSHVMDNQENEFNVDLETLFTASEEQALWQKLAAMRETIEQNHTEQTTENLEVMIFSTVTLTAGFVSWILRGGALLASLLPSIPLLKGFDPLPIVVKSNKASKSLKSGKQAEAYDTQDDKVEQMFANVTDE